MSLLRRIQEPLRRVARATQNALEIIRFGRLSAPYGAPFEVVHEDRICSLRRYLGPGAPAADAGPPLLLVPPLMVASEVYDIAPDVSAVAYLVREGIDVWLADFGAPERVEGGMERTLDDHVRAISDAVDRVSAARGGRPVHIAGYSQGGMFVYQVAALRRSAGLGSVITFGAPVDVHQTVGVDDAIIERLLGLLRRVLAFPLERTEGLPGVITSTGFKLFAARKEVGQLLEFVSKLHDREALEKREAKRLFLRGQGFVAWPGPAFRKFVDEVIVANRMATGGFVLDGRPVTLADIRCPILCFVGERDDMARPRAVRAIRDAAPQAEVFEVDVRAGHFGLVVGSSALKVTWPTVAAWLRWRDQAGPAPAALATAMRGRRAAAAPRDEGDDEELGGLQLDVDLARDVVAEAARALWNRVEDRARDLFGSLDHMRLQVPRLERLASLAPSTPVSIGRSLADQAAAIPDRTFFIWRGRAFTYRDADTRVNHVVRGLIACGVRPRQQVALLMAGRPSFLTVVAALSRIGAVAVMLNPAGDDTLIAASLAGVDLAAILADPEHAARARALYAGPVLVLGAAHEQRALGAGVIDLEAINPEAIKLPDWYTPNPGRAGDLAMIIPSAGRAEVRPARVTNGRWAFSALGAAAACTLSSADTIYCCLPLHHAAGSMVAAGSALAGGARLALADRFDLEAFWPEVRRYGATVVFYAGEMCRQLVDAPHTRGERNHPVRLWAGSGMRPDVWRRLRERFGPVGVLEFYAATEANAVLANASGRKVGAVGRPFPGSAELAIVRWDAGAQQVVRGADGRCLRAAVDEPGVLLARLDEAQAAALPPHRLQRGALADGDAWYATGDLFRLDADGDYWFIDRAADLVRTPAGPVAPSEIEDALARAPGVALVVAYGLPARQGGGEEPVAIVVPRASGELSAEALRTAAAALPAHARPHRVWAVDQVPMTEGFRALRRPLAAAGWRTEPADRTFEL